MLVPVLLFAICFGIDWRYSLVLLACVPLIPLSIVAVSRYAKKIFTKYWSKYTSMGDSFLDSVQGMKELKIFKADEAQQEKMNQKAEEFRKITMKVLVMQWASTTIMDLVAYGGAGTGIVLSVVSLINGELAPASALFLILVAVEFFLPMRALGSAFHVAMNGASAGRKILSLLNFPDPKWGDKEVEEVQLRMKDVTFYDGERPVLKNIDMDFPKRGMIAIVGESGCGKTTLLNLIARLEKLSGGEITQYLDERFQKRKRGSKAWFRKVGVVYQNPDYQLSMPSVEKEIEFGADSKEYVGHIAELFHIKHLFPRHPQALSQGQKRLVSIAAVLAGKPEVLLLDEPTVGQDYERLCQMVKVLNEIHAKTKNTMITITHDLRCAEALCDTAYWIADGVVKKGGGKRTHTRIFQSINEERNKRCRFQLKFKIRHF